MFFFTRKGQDFLLINTINSYMALSTFSSLHNVDLNVYAYQTKINVTIHKYK